MCEQWQLNRQTNLCMPADVLILYNISPSVFLACNPVQMLIDNMHDDRPRQGARLAERRSCKAGRGLKNVRITERHNTCNAMWVDTPVG